MEFKLEPVDGRKSFYGKAVVLRDPDRATLKSYDTLVAKIEFDGSGSRFVRLWNGYSATTMRHVNAFVSYYGLEGGGKKWWDSLEVGEL